LSVKNKPIHTSPRSAIKRRHCRVRRFTSIRNVKSDRLYPRKWCASKSRAEMLWTKNARIKIVLGKGKNIEEKLKIWDTSFF